MGLSLAVSKIRRNKKPSMALFPIEAAAIMLFSRILIPLSDKGWTGQPYRW